MRETDGQTKQNCYINIAINIGGRDLWAEIISIMRKHSVNHVHGF